LKCVNIVDLKERQRREGERERKRERSFGVLLYFQHSGG
jgi:hypothetical protein